MNLKLPEGWNIQPIKETHVRARLRKGSQTLAFVEIEQGAEYAITCHAKMLWQVERTAYSPSFEKAVRVAQDYINDVHANMEAS